MSLLPFLQSSPSTRMKSTKRSLSPVEEPPQLTKRTKKQHEVSKSDQQRPQKKSRNSIYETPGIVATFDAATAADADPPYLRLNRARTEHKKEMLSKNVRGDAVVYWMRMEDMRVVDNRALAGASAAAQREGLPLVVIFVFTPGDYRAHERSSRRIEFVLRTLDKLARTLAESHIPLWTWTYEGNRKNVSLAVLEKIRTWNAKMLFANIEYQVDELRRDIQLLEEAPSHGIRVDLYHDRCLVEPGKVTTKDGSKVPVVFSPWLRTWIAFLQGNPSCYEEVPPPKPNPLSIHDHPVLSELFNHQLPDEIPGFECEDAQKMAELWPEGTDAGVEALVRFCSTKARKSQVGDMPLLEPGAPVASEKTSRIGLYEAQRVRLDMDSSSRISPYLACGALSARLCVRTVMTQMNIKKFDAPRGSGPGVWFQEIAWRDFYTHVMAAYPRTSMGRPFQEKFADVFWEEDVDGTVLQRWKDGQTGYPIVDAAMRQCKTQGYMHNRGRMIAAMFLTKHLMIDWRLGERYFMQSFIDGDLMSNNGGWQWCASTGTDAQPYFRIFNPYLQSEKADPEGDYIRHFVPELRELKGKAIHDPFTNLPKPQFAKLGYPKPIVEHKAARDRAIRRFKNVGAE